jgi:hypothetical protein
MSIGEVIMEEGWNLGPILIPLLALLAGWAIGFFDSNMRTSKKIKQAEDSAQVAIKNAEDKIADAQARIAAIPETPITVDDPGLMRIKNENGILTLDLDGRRVNTSAITVDQRKRLVEMLNTIRPWLEGRPVPAPAQTPLPPAKPAPVQAPAVSPPPRPAAPAQTPAPKATTPAKKGEEPPAPPTSIVGQINLILQSRIINTPLASKGVSLMESSIGGVNVFIGIQRYEALDDVPDEEVKAAIRAAIVEWEKKYTPGY